MKTIIAIVALSNVATALEQWNTCKSISDCDGQGKGTQCCSLAYDSNYNAYKGGVKICADKNQIIVPLAVKSKFTKHEGWMYSCTYGGPTASPATSDKTPDAKDATAVAVAPKTPVAAPSAASDPTYTPVQGKGFQWNTCKTVSDCDGQGKGTQCCSLAYDSNYNAYKGGVKVCADKSQIIVPLAVKSKFTKHEGWMYSCTYGGPTASPYDATAAPPVHKNATPVAVAPPTYTPVQGKGFQWNTCKTVSDCDGQGKGTQCCSLAYDSNYNAYKGGVKVCADKSQIIIPLAVKSKFTGHEGWMYSCTYGGPTASPYDATAAPPVHENATPVAVAPPTPAEVAPPDVASTGYAQGGSLPTGFNCTGTFQCQVQGSCCLPWASTPGGATKKTNVCFPPGSNGYSAVYSNGVGRYPAQPCYIMMAGASALSVSVAVVATAALAIY